MAVSSYFLLNSVATIVKFKLWGEKIMNIKWEQEWDRIYKDQGEVQFDILPTVSVAIDIFRGNDSKRIMDLGCGTGFCGYINKIINNSYFFSR